MADRNNPAPGTPSRDWREERSSLPPEQRPAANRNRRRLKRLYAVLATVVVLATLLLILLQLLAGFDSPYFLSVAVTDYEQHCYPTNAWAAQDGKALLEHFPNSTRDVSSTRQEKDLLLKQLADLRHRKSSQALVLHVNTLAVVEGGAVYLLPLDAQPDKQDKWVPLAELLKAVRDCPSRNKLLLLDLAHPVADPRLGVLADDVAEHLETAVKEVKDRGLWVLSACAPGQVALPLEDARMSVFGYYLNVGLRGAADGYPEGAPNYHVSVKELTAFVRDRVAGWAWRNRGTRQTPMLLHQGENDFDLAALPQGGSTKQPPEPAAPTYPDPLLAGWKLRDRWLADGTPGVAPLAMRQLEALLLRAEGRWRGGVDEPTVESDLKTGLDKLERQVKQARSRIPASQGRPASLALWSRTHEPDPEVGKTVAALLAKAEAGGFKPAEADVAAKELEKLKGKPLFAESAAKAVFAAATANDAPPKLDKIRFLNRLLTSLEPAFVETLFLRRLVEWQEKDGPEWPADVVQRALWVVRDGEQAENGDPRVFPWVQALLQTAGDFRKEGEAALLARGEDAQIDKADEAFKKAGRLYEDVHRYAGYVREAQHIDDQARAVLPGYARYLARLPRVAARDEDDWNDAARQTRALGGLLAKVSAAATPVNPEAQTIDDVHAQAQRLKDTLSRLRAPFEEKNRKKLKREDEPSAVARAFDLMLTVPVRNADERLALWKETRELSARLHQETAQEDLRPPAGATKSDEPERAQRRARFAIAWLQTGGLDEAPLEELRKSLRRGDQPALARGLRQALYKKAPEQFRRLLDQKALLDADRLGRILHPFDLEGLPSLGRAESYPAALLRREEALHQWRWLGDRYLQRAGPDVYGQFFDRAANDYLRSSR
jgi:hypothetical protein